MYLLNKTKVIFNHKIQVKMMAFNKTLRRFTTCCSYFRKFPILLIIIILSIASSTILAAAENQIIFNHINNNNNNNHHHPQHLDYQSQSFSSHATRRNQLHQGSPPILQIQNNNINKPVQLISPSLSINLAQQQTQTQTQTPTQLQVGAFSKAADEALLELRQQMITRSMKFDEHFRQLLSNSKLSLHNLFADTYGMMYERNTEIFTGMFDSLEQYYAGGDIKLTKSMEIFFERLYQKIFQAYNTNKVFPPPYLECLTEQLAHLKPFKDVPDKLIDGIRHAFVAARTFNQALSSGITVIKNIVSVSSGFLNLLSHLILKS